MRRLAVLVVVTALSGCGAATPDPGAVARGPLPASEGAERSAPDPGAPVDAVADGFNDAGFDLLRRQPEGDNVVFSPSSIGHALLMARAAADAPTGAAIDAALGLPAGRAAHEAWNALAHRLDASAAEHEELGIVMADRIWPRLGLEPDQAWVDLLAAEHEAQVQPLDLAGDPEGSRAAVNDWVSDETRGLIPDLLPEGSIDPRTLLVLTDALYLEARWQHVFGKYGSEEATFTRLDGSTVPVTLMRELELGDRRGSGDGFVGAEIPYVGGELSMLVVVPDRGRYPEVRERLDQALLDEIDETFSTRPFELLLPRWEDHSRVDLLPWLRDLGAAPGRFPAIGPDAFLDAAVHGADIAVDEWGTVAAAGTALAFGESGPPEPELTVRADRPFLYLVRHRPTGLVLFAGQVPDPS